MNVPCINIPLAWTAREWLSPNAVYIAFVICCPVGVGACCAAAEPSAGAACDVCAFAHGTKKQHTIGNAGSHLIPVIRSIAFLLVFRFGFIGVSPLKFALTFCIERSASALT